jgi:imidazolonepropionase-like amidohydrolase
MRIRLMRVIVGMVAGMMGLALSVSSGAAQNAQYIRTDAAVVVLNHVTVIDGTGAEGVEDQTIVIRDGDIEAVGAFGSVTVPAGAESFDLSGHTVIPGIVGLHDHMYLSSNMGSMRPQLSTYPMLFLAAGVTTIRTTGSVDPYQELNMKAAIDEGSRIGPEIYVTGPYLQGPTSPMGVMHELGDEEDVRRLVRYWAQEGVSWFKAYTTISRAQLGAAIDEAHKYGVKVTAHLCSVTFREAVNLGIDHLEHGFDTDLQYFPGKQEDECPLNSAESYEEMLQTYAAIDIGEPRVQATISHMIEGGVGLTSTLAVNEIGKPSFYELDQRVLDVLHPEIAEWVEDQYEARKPEATETGAQMMSRLWEFEKSFYDQGGLLTAGSDPCCVWVIAGFADQRNYELLAGRGGFSAGEAVQVMTYNGAQALGIGDRVGRIQPGMQADLIVLKGALAEDPTVIQNTRIVFRKGIGYDSPAILERLKGRVGR